MKKYIVGGVIAALIVIYVIFVNVQNPGTNMNGPMSDAGGPGTVGTPTSTAGSPAPVPSAPVATPTATPTPGAGQYKDGTYTGPVANAFYGNIQVVATIQGGRITDVGVPVYPNAPGHTTDVTNMAIPALKQEAIQAQSANVNIVSGATQDSQAFQQSLAAALAGAMN